MTQKITPNIWYDGNAEEAGRFYADAFTSAGLAARSTVEGRYPTDGLLDFQRELAGKALTVGVEIEGARLVLINAGPEYRPNPSISFMLNFDPLLFGGDELAARASMDRLWGALSDGASTLMPLAEYPFSAHYGWMQDRYGVNWQLMLTRPEGDPRPFLIPALMFDGPSQGRAAEAADLYVSLFADAAGGSAVGNRATYGAPAGKASAEELAFGEFRIGDQWFMGADNGSGNDFGFSAAVSLQVDCEDQAEIDRLWSALSSVPEAERCGWLIDPFGVSWQIVPAHLEELMQRPDAYAHLMQMTKIVIDEF